MFLVEEISTSPCFVWMEMALDGQRGRGVVFLKHTNGIESLVRRTEISAFKRRFFGAKNYVCHRKKGVIGDNEI